MERPFTSPFLATLSLLLFAGFTPSNFTVPLYSQREAVSCIYCHVNPKARALNEAGIFYRRNGNRFPFQYKPRLSEQFKDSRTDPVFLKLKHRFQKKYARRDPIQAYVKRGKKLFFGSIPMEKKSSKNCVSCHTPGEIAQVNKLYPRYVPLASKIMSLEQMQNYCIKNHLAGKPFKPGSKDSLSISAYINNIALK